MCHPHEKYGKQVIEMLQSFNTAIRLAGGSIYTAERLRVTTAEELFLQLASNGIRFIYQPPEED